MQRCYYLGEGGDNLFFVKRESFDFKGGIEESQERDSHGWSWK